MYQEQARTTDCSFRTSGPSPATHQYKLGLALRPTNLIQHHITDMGQSLRLLHTGKDELKAKQELTVITFFLLKV